ncbi:MAG: hypothetical protein AB1472_06305 [Candidatus Omnitrophota bacterium]
MKKRIFLILIAFFSFIQIGFAAGINGAQTHGKNKVSIGLEQEFVFDRNLERDPWSYSRVWYVPAAPVIGRLIYEFKPTTSEVNKLYRTLIKVSYGLLDNLDIYVKLGTSDTQIRQNYDGLVGGFPMSSLGGGFNYRTEGPTFVYGGGIKATYDLTKGWFVGCDAQYLTSKSDYYLSNIATVQILGLGILDSVESYRGELLFQEWHVAPYLAKKIGKFSPYLGLRYSDSKIRDRSRIAAQNAFLDMQFFLPDLSQSSYSHRYKAENNLGIFFGTDYKVNKNWTLNLEAHFRDEYVINFSGTYSFGGRDIKEKEIDAASGLTETQGKDKFGIGLEQEFLFDKELEKKPQVFNRVITPLINPGFIPGPGPFRPFLAMAELNFTSFKVNKSYDTLLKLNYGVLDDLDVFVKLGTRDTELRNSYNGMWTGTVPVLGFIQIPIGGDMKIYSQDPVFVYGGGIKAKHEFKQGWIVGCEAQYLRSKNEYASENSLLFTMPGLGVGQPLYGFEKWEGTLTFQEWHVAPYLAKKIGKFSPYLGLRYSDLHITDKPRSGLYSTLVSVPLGLVGGLYREEDTYYKTKLKAEDNLGIFFGTDYKITKNLSLNVEAHLLDEYALKFGGTLKF